ncbi:hypothetical protein HDR58_06755 [bacterium]|nr:hypothetical protein [bacterium]
MISGVSNSSNTAEVRKTTSTAKSATTNTVKIGKSSNNGVSKAKKEAAENLKMRVLQLLNLKDDFLKVSVEVINNKSYVKISRPANDKRRTAQRREFSNGAIKEKLGIKKGVLKANNDLVDVTGSPNLSESYGATIEPGKSLLIPISDLGQDYPWYKFGAKDLKNYANNYLQTE